MMKSNLLLLLSFLFFPTLSFGESAKLPFGIYAKQSFDIITLGTTTIQEISTDARDRKANGRFEAGLDDGIFSLKDLSTNISYQLNLKSEKEQDLPKEYLNYIKSKMNIALLARLVDRISISNVHPGIVQNSYEGHVNIYLKYKFSGHELNGKITLNGMLHFADIQIKKYNDNYTEEKIFKLPTLYSYLNGNIEIESLTVGNSLVDRALRAIFEHFIKSNPFAFVGGCALVPTFGAPELEVSK